MQFNPIVHEQTEQGDPLRNDDGTIRLKRNWKDVAEDRQGRTFNKHVHGDKPELDDNGFLKVRRREGKPPVGTVNRTEAFMNKYREPGYAYRIANDDGGRLDQLTENDWEPVVDKNGRAEIKVGQARSPNTVAVLMRKPLEWFEEDQRKKRAARIDQLAKNTAPKEAEGQYEATKSSPLR